MSSSVRFSLSYKIAFEFERRIKLSTHWARLRPAPHTRAKVAAYTLAIDADPHFVNWVRDPFENYLARLDFHEPLKKMALNMELLLDLTPANPFDFLVEPDASNYPFNYPEQLAKELFPYLQLPKTGPRLGEWLELLNLEEAYTVDALTNINSQIHEAIKLVGEVKPGPVNLEQVLVHGTGTAWEIAWLLTLSLRRLGLAARFVSGLHLFQSTSPELPDSGSLHAWSEVYLPGAGWVGLDPGNGVFTAEGHVPLATAPDPLRALPLVGYFESCQYETHTSVDVKRLTPQTQDWPLSAEHWNDIGLVAQSVDNKLAEENIQSSSAPTLTFVASAYANEPEWSVDAMGHNKQIYAENLLVRLHRRLAPGGVFQYGQGEWFSGESLPRWRLHCMYRRDGQACWQIPKWLANSSDRGDSTPDDARLFLKLLARVLDIRSSFVVPAHEDLLHELWANRNYLNYSPELSELGDPMQRLQLADRLSTSKSTPTAYVLPLRWDPVSERWTSGIWQFRRKNLYLIPGTSAPGFRLPLDSLPRDRDAIAAPDPDRSHFDPREEILPSLHGELSARFSSIPPNPEEDELPHSADEVTHHAAPRTALCVDVRNGIVHIFIPPLTHLEHYLELIAAIETVASKREIQVILEGYEPPYDARLQRIIIEADPGVLKVTLPEARDWNEAKHIIDAAYEEAAALGLYGERYTTDGRRHPSGGGAELSVGGIDPTCSPFLQRPEILRSFISYWQNHPSLSYLFAGRMIGPSGNAPRVDLGRDDALYDLDMALKRIPNGMNAKPWEPDRILRHLLTDAKGDMRKAEIRVDQLYPPERSATRTGRITIRSFEMPPTQRQAALQWLLIRVLLAMFAKNPRRASLTRWEGALDDKFMLAEWLWLDFLEIIKDLHEAGIPMQAEWFQPYLELRFPMLGNVQIGDLKLELRNAHEAWPLLAEEVTANGMSRFIDTANQRIEIKLTGATPGRYAVLCNDKRVPLKESRQIGYYVAGVRYKASNPDSTLHPTIPITGALVFDVVDLWTNKVIGGCTYLPPQPAIYGPAGLPPALPFDASKGPEEWHQLLPPAIPTPPWFSTVGRFLPHGSGRSELKAPEVVGNSRLPNLLDLTFM